MQAQRLARGWVGLTAVLSIGSIFQAWDHRLLGVKVFNQRGLHQITPLAARMFSQLNGIMTIIRFLYPIFYDEKGVFVLTVLSYVQCLVWYLLEILVYKSATMNFGTIGNISISALSLVLLGVTRAMSVQQVETPTDRRGLKSYEQKRANLAKIQSGHPKHE